MAVIVSVHHIPVIQRQRLLALAPGVTDMQIRIMRWIGDIPEGNMVARQISREILGAGIEKTQLQSATPANIHLKARSHTKPLTQVIFVLQRHDYSLGVLIQ